MSNHYDIVVIGGGHAGVEAAWASARLGARTALITMSFEGIGRMSCNPAIGGIGKGQMVREIDALGGVMGLAADEGCIQFRVLNKRKGPAVWAPRAQADRKLYPKAVQKILQSEGNLDIVVGMVDQIRVKDIAPQNGGADRRISGVTLVDGRSFSCDAAILAAGTFMCGLMHCGEEKIPGGRLGEEAATGLSGNLRDLGFTLERLKTGTPPRVDVNTLDFDQIERQDGDPYPVPFSFMNERITQKQINCWITYTNENTHKLIRGNLDRAPLYSGQINSTGPRYCPSIEDKIVRFADKSRHQLFLEPEGYDSDWIYCNGIPTSLPRDVQDLMIGSIAGLQKARIVQYGYAIEYDFVPANQTRLTLESRQIDNFYLAGQVNGTSGYEEAAGQGLVAGLNAARKLVGKTPIILGRDEAYIGVMIDDLVTKPPLEPYRMFTSRAEYRLALRSDNADSRLTPLGREVGLVDDQRWERFDLKRDKVNELAGMVRTLPYDGHKLASVLKRPDTKVSVIEEVLESNGIEAFPLEVMQQVLIDFRYEGYLVRQQKQVNRFKKMESMRIPPHTDFSKMAELRAEAREKLTAFSPDTLGQAGRIPGISPADILALWVYVAGRKSL